MKSVHCPRQSRTAKISTNQWPRSASHLNHRATITITRRLTSIWIIKSATATTKLSENLALVALYCTEAATSQPFWPRPRHPLQHLMSSISAKRICKIASSLFPDRRKCPLLAAVEENPLTTCWSIWQVEHLLIRLLSLCLRLTKTRVI